MKTKLNEMITRILKPKLFISVRKAMVFRSTFSVKDEFCVNKSNTLEAEATTAGGNEFEKR